METIDFYRAVLPAEGHTILFQNKKHSYFTSLSSLAKATLSRSGSQNLYFAVASFGDAKNRTGENVHLLQSHRVDIDAGEVKTAKYGDAVYATQAEAIKALGNAIRAGLPRASLIVSSGEGLHVYWALRHPSIPAQWKPVALALGAACKALGLKVDTPCTADTSRVLRPVGTLHPNGKRVEVLKDTGVRYVQDELMAKLLPLVPEGMRFEVRGAAEVHEPGINDDVLGFAEQPASLAQVAEHCSATARLRDTSGNVPEPLWRAIIGVGKYCMIDGLPLIHEWSSGYEGYTVEETQGKFDLWVKPPPTCAHIATLHDGCTTCPHWNKITTPKQLGVIVEEAEVEPPAPAQRAPKLPKPAKPKPELEPELIDQPTAEIPVPGRPDLFSDKSDFYYRPVGGNWTLMHRFSSKGKDGTGKESWNTRLVRVIHTLIWREASSDLGGNNGGGTSGVIWHFGRVNKLGAAEQTSFDMPAGIGTSLEPMCRALAEQGVNLDASNKDAAFHLKKFIASEAVRMQNHMNFVIRSRFGYHFYEGEFICAMGRNTVYPDGSVRRHMCNPKLGGAADALEINCLPKSLSQRWGVEVWPEIVGHMKNYVGFLRKHYNHEDYGVARLSLALSLASPLLAFTADTEITPDSAMPPIGFVVSMYSQQSGTGKTSLMDSVAAAFGKPELKRTGKKAALTVVAANTLAANMSIYPFLLDEVTGNDATEAAAMVDSFANGSGKVRADQSGAVAQSSSTWSLITCVSTNKPQRELLTISERKGNALQMRLLELNFDGVPKAPDAGAFAADLRGVFRNSGAFGLVLARLVVQRGPKEITEICVAQIARAYKLLEVTQQFRFYARALAALLATNQLLGKWAPFDEADLVATFKEALQAGIGYIEATHMTPEAEVTRMLSDMSPYIAVTKSLCLRDTDVDTLLNPNVKLPLRGRQIKDRQLTFVDNIAVINWCAVNNMSRSAFMKNAAKAGLLQPGKQGDTTRFTLTRGIPELATFRGNFCIFRHKAAVGSGNNVVQLYPNQPPAPPPNGGTPNETDIA